MAGTSPAMTGGVSTVIPGRERKRADPESRPGTNIGNLDLGSGAARRLGMTSGPEPRTGNLVILRPVTFLHRLSCESHFFVLVQFTVVTAQVFRRLPP